VTRNVPTAAPSSTAAEVRNSLVGASFESVADVAVLDGERLAGLVRLEHLLAAAPGTLMSSLMDLDPPVAGPAVDQERAAWRMVVHGETRLAVGGEDGRFHGLIPPNRMLAVLLEEHEEDVARLGGYLASTEQARSAAEEEVRRRLWHRLPWLLLGLVGAMASALLVGAFEEELQKKVLLAFFVPAVVYMADAVGGQTRVILIRGLSVGITIREVLARELLTGALAGIVVGVAFVPFALVGWDDGGVAAAVALALFASCAIATLVAMALPWAFQRLGSDPAFGSGPLATVIQDLLSIAVYLGIAMPLAT
jgi:magnesium transporter